MPLFLQAFLETATNEQKQGLHDWLYNTPDIQVLIGLWEAGQLSAVPDYRIYRGRGRHCAADCGH
jgi:hypothetical protein